MTGSIFVIFCLRKVIFGYLHSANVIQIAWMAIFPQFSIDFVQISLLSDTLSKETKGQDIVQENFTPGQGIIFRNLTRDRVAF